MKTKVLLLLLLAVSVQGMAQQTPQLNQYLFNGIYINPAYAGYKESTYLHSFARSQWTGMEGAPTTMSASIDASLDDGNMGLALMLNHDQIGAQTQSAAYLNYAYRIRIGNDEMSKLSFGIGAGVLQSGLNGSKLRYAEEENSMPMGTINKLMPNARAGIYYSNQHFFTGISAENLLTNRQLRTESELIPIPQTHVYFTAGAIFPIGQGLEMKPSILIKDDFRGPTSVDLNAFMLLNERVWIGGFYRRSMNLMQREYLKGLGNSSSLGFTSEVLVMQSIRVGYAFDYSLATTVGRAPGSHELSLGFSLGRRSMSNA